MSLILDFKRQLDATDPRLWYILVAVLTGCVIECWRRLHPASFKKLPSRLKAIPPMLVGAVINVTPSESPKQAFWNALAGFLMGLFAVGGYEAKVRLLSGRGSRPQPEPERPKE